MLMLLFIFLGSDPLTVFSCRRLFFNLFVGCRQDFKFFSEMDGIFRKQLKVDDSDSDLLAPEEPEEYGAEPDLGRGEAFGSAAGDSQRTKLINHGNRFLRRSRLERSVDAGKFQADLDGQRDRGAPEHLEERRHPADAEGLGDEQADLLAGLRAPGQPGLPANTRAVSEQDKEAEGQFPTIPGREKVGSVSGWGVLFGQPYPRCPGVCF